MEVFSLSLNVERTEIHWNIVPMSIIDQIFLIPSLDSWKISGIFSIGGIKIMF